LSREKPLLVSRIRHENVVYIEVVRGAGIGREGDLITVAVKQSSPPPFIVELLPYYGARDVAVNKYRLSERIDSIDVIDNGLRERYGPDAYRVVDEGSTWRLETRRLGGRHPSALLEIRHYGDVATLRIYLAPSE